MTERLSHSVALVVDDPNKPKRITQVYPDRLMWSHEDAFLGRVSEDAAKLLAMISGVHVEAVTSREVGGKEEYSFLLLDDEIAAEYPNQPRSFSITTHDWEERPYSPEYDARVVKAVEKNYGEGLIVVIQ